jgi:hypothetical protein
MRNLYAALLTLSLAHPTGLFWTYIIVAILNLHPSFLQIIFYWSVLIPLTSIIIYLILKKAGSGIGVMVLLFTIFYYIWLLSG